ncbi:MAG: glycosyltransferase family 4 protein [Lentisphaeria bacterium]|nr:glycosyltransferase family 4 protein [Lentisphaeria bacterium]
MKLAFTIFRYFPYGGLQLDFARFLREGIRRGHSITVLYDRWEGDFIPGAEYVQLDCRALTNWGRAASFEKQTKAFLHEHPCDRVIGCNKISGLDFYFAADSCFLAHAVKQLPLLHRLIFRYRTFERMERAVFGPESDCVILYISERQKTEYIRFYGTPEKRFRYLPPGVSEEFFLHDPAETASLRRSVRAEWNIPEEKILLLQVCSSFRTKGTDRVLQALAALPVELRGKLVFLAVGDDKRNKCPSMADRLGLREQVIFTGPRSDVSRLMAAADLMVHPARNEAAGNVLAEASACGLPVICSGACGYAPLVNEAGGVVLPEPFTVSALRDALELSLSLPNALNGLRRTAVRYAEKADFHHRTECFWNFIEETAHA